MSSAAVKKKPPSAKKESAPWGKFVGPKIRNETIDLLTDVFGSPNAGALFLIETWPTALGETLAGLGGRFSAGEIKMLRAMAKPKPDYRSPRLDIGAVSMLADMFIRVSELTLEEHVAISAWAALECPAIGPFSIKPKARS